MKFYEDLKINKNKPNYDIIMNRGPQIIILTNEFPYKEIYFDKLTKVKRPKKGEAMVRFGIRTSLFPLKTALGKFNINIYKNEWLVDVIPKLDLTTMESIKSMIDTISSRLVKFLVGSDQQGKMARMPYFRVQSLHNICGVVIKTCHMLDRSYCNAISATISMCKLVIDLVGSQPFSLKSIQEMVGTDQSKLDIINQFIQTDQKLESHMDIHGYLNCFDTLEVSKFIIYHYPH